VAHETIALTTELCEPWLCSAVGVFMMTWPRMTTVRRTTMKMGMGSRPRIINEHAWGEGGDAADTRSRKYCIWGSSPRPMAHKTIALTTEL